MNKGSAIFGFILAFIAGLVLGRVSVTGVTAKDQAEITKKEAVEVSAKKVDDKKATDPNDPNAVYRVPLGNSPSKGPDNAKVTIVEFSDYECPFCGRAEEVVKKVTEKYKNDVKVVWKNNPLPFHKNAMGAAKAALAAGAQGKFWEMHAKLFQDTKALSEDNLKKYAGELDLDMAKFNEAMEKNVDQAKIAADQRLARMLGARGTPTFFVNGKKLAGAQPLEKFSALIDEEIKRADKMIASGVSIQSLYNEIIKDGLTTAAPPKAQQRPDQPKRPQADSKTVYKVDVPTASPYKGAKDALVTIVEFSEFQCPFCSRVNPTMDRILKDYEGKVKVVFRHNPLGFHKNAALAAEATMAAHDQGKFWEMHDKLFANQRTLERENLEKYAEEVGLDMAKFKASLDANAHKSIIDEDQKAAMTLGARGTPGFFINGRNLRGAQPFEKFKEIIDEEIKKAEALLGKGVKLEALYAELTKNGLTKAAAPAAPQRPPEDNKTVFKATLRGDEPYKGAEDAQITILEFSEFQCPFCTRVNPTMDRIMKEYEGKVKVVFKHNPLPFHKNAGIAAEASLAAHDQGKFWEMHDKLFANQKALERENLEQYASEIGLDMGRFKAALDANAHKDIIAKDQAQAMKLGSRGTPGFFINGRSLRGAQPFERFKELIDEEITKTDAMLAKGIAKKDLYAEIMKTGKDAPPPPTPQGQPEGPIASDKKFDVKVGKAPAKGPANAPITIVVFSDFECPFCSRAENTIDQLMKEYEGKVRFAFKNNPLPFHKNAPMAAQAAMAAHAQGKFWEMHDKLFANSRALDRDNLEKYAQEVGLDMTSFKKDLDGSTYKDLIDSDMAEAKTVGARGTPTFFINGRLLSGARPIEQFKQVIDEELKTTK